MRISIRPLLMFVTLVQKICILMTSLLEKMEIFLEMVFILLFDDKQFGLEVPPAIDPSSQAIVMKP